MGRRLEGHIVNPANDKLDIEVLGEPGVGGAHHRYEITGFDTDGNPSSGIRDEFDGPFSSTTILFQNGAIAESGVNGITHEALLAILVDRMEGFQSGPYASADNAEALDAMRAAQIALRRRTKERMARGVEGTLER